MHADDPLSVRGALLDDQRAGVLFERGFAAHEIGARKPDPEAFEFACRALDVAPSQVCGHARSYPFR